MTDRLCQAARYLCVGAMLSAAGVVRAQEASAGGAKGSDMNPFDHDYRTRIRELCETYDWAREQRKNVLDGCARWVAMSETELRRAVPSQMVPRSLYLNRKYGCPNCGDEVFRHGYYPWRMDPEKHPWKVQCPACEELFPKNDFYAYYISGLDENDMFVPDKADASLLFNEEHPDPNDPLHTYGVDPGTGFNDPEKGSFKFVAHYNHHVNWGANARYPLSRHSVTSAATGLGYAWALTGDETYARTGAILLERLADVYPDLDFEYWASRGGYHQYRGIYGTAVDSTWSTRVAFDLARAYALIRDAFAERPALMRKIESNILRETFEKQKQSIIWGNTGFNEETAMMVMLAATDEALRQEIAAWLFSNAEGEPIPSPHSSWRETRPGGGLGRTVASLSQAGFSWEGGFGYSAILPLFLTKSYRSLQACAEATQSRDADLVMDLLKQRLPAFYKNSYQLVSLGKYMPVWGDGGRFGTPMIPKGAVPENLFAAFAALDDPELGRMYWAMSGDSDVPRGDILDPHIEYERTKQRLETLREEHEAPPRTSANMPGRGFTVMRSGSGQFERSLIGYYGSNTGHNHREIGNLYLFAYGLDLMPGLGYPNISNRLWRAGFWDKPISHNTVATEWDTGPQDVRLAHQTLFVTSPLASLTEIDANRVYPELTRYSRLPVLVSLSDEAFYVVDFFRIGGGSDHIYSFHSGVGSVNLSGATFAEQQGGSYAGEDVPFATKIEGEGWRIGGGLQFFRNVKRADMAGPVAAEWQLENTNDVSSFGDDVRLRFTLLSPMCEVALASSQPPQNIPGNPEHLPYLLARKRTSADDAFVYTGVIEPFLEGKRGIDSMRTLTIEGGGASDSAVEITLAGGGRDIIVQQAGAPRTITVEGGIRFNGKLLLARFDRDGAVSEVLAVRPSLVALGQAFEKTCQPAAHGKVVSFDRGAPERCTITIDQALEIPKDALRPLWTDVTPSPDANGNYQVRAVNVEGDRTVLDVGKVSLISGFDSETEQVTYAFEPGATLAIPFSYYWKRP